MRTAFTTRAGQLLLLALAAVLAGCGPPAGPMTPFWRTKTMIGDPLLFVQGEGRDLATASLLFTPRAMPELASATGGVTFAPGRDFTWKPGTREIVLTRDSRLPFKTAAQLHPPPGSPQSKSNGSNALFWSEGHVFHDLQVVATYRHAERWSGPTPPFSGTQLPRTLAKLKAGQPVTIVALGDSITAGYNASELTQTAPFQPAYPKLVAARLQEHYHAEVRLVNLAVAGKTSAWGLTRAPQVAAEKPDLVIIAFGMNETRGTAASFAHNVGATVQAIRALKPDTEFLLVAGMAGNPEWKGLRAAAFPEFRDALTPLNTNGVVVADVTSLWLALSARKSFADLTGNGLNHPNDFGHRVYAQVLMSHLTR